MKTLKYLILAIVIGTVAACKLAVIVVEGGEVQSTGSGTCVAGSVCIVDVNDTNFSETFTAVPDEGWRFEKWNSGSSFWCADYTEPTCPVSSEGAPGIPWAERLIASSKTFYLMPVFKMANPITDTVTVDGKEWAQVDLFTNLSWNEINAVCAGGGCSGTLSDFDMTGWSWASVDDINTLFNYYIGSNELGPGPDNYGVDGFSGTAAWVTAFYDDGWRAIFELETIRITEGLLHDLENGEGLIARLADPNENSSDIWNEARTDVTNQVDEKVELTGAWFYRTP